MDRRQRYLGPALAAVALVDSARRARRGKVSPCEERAFRILNDGPEAIRWPVWAVMQSGSLAAVLVVSADRYRRGRVAVAGTSLVAGTLVWGGVKFVKPMVGRGRPEGHLDGVSVRGKAQTGLGYPSGHAAVATTLALIITRDLGPVTRAATLGVAAVTGVARVYVGAHLPVDVVGGAAIGVLSGQAANAIFRSIEKQCAQ